MRKYNNNLRIILKFTETKKDTKMAKIACIGSSNVDLIAYVDKIPRPGETLFGNSFQSCFGGKGANQAVQCARLAIASEDDVSAPSTVAMIACVGDDSFGKDMLLSFKKDRIDVDHVKTIPNVSSGVAPILVDSKGENSIVVISGANGHVSAAQAETAVLSLDKLNCLISQFEVPIDAIISAFSTLKKKSTPTLTILTPAPVPKTLPSIDLFRVTDILIPNAIEVCDLAMLVSPDRINEIQSISDDERRVEVCSNILIQVGVKALIITKGSHGCLIVMKELGSPISIPAYHVDHVVDTTGAGDSFSGAFAYFYSHLIPADVSLSSSDIHVPSLIEAVKRASVVAGFSVMSKGTQTSYKKRYELPKELFNDIL
jgi:ribokinase